MFDSSEFLVFVLALLVTIIVHEAIHGAVARLLGYHVTYGVAWSVLGVYTASFGQLISRRDNVLVAGAPLVALTGVGVVILPFVDETLLAAVLVGLVANTASAVGDLYVLYRLVRMPRGSMLYDVSIEEMLVYEPSSASAVGHAE
ncbi:DUF3267 domain-containing protein [Halococcus thailandensis]|uniref:DUF3267 domain-containing protein n=1 Tax=Halococcus thailandensis TaxID=335952 RepID=UPI001F4CDD09|nr:DUF3267 domain-containing protein [Halococcus thailandensis]